MYGLTTLGKEKQKSTIIPSTSPVYNEPVTPRFLRPDFVETPCKTVDAQEPRQKRASFDLYIVR